MEPKTLKISFVINDGENQDNINHEIAFEQIHAGLPIRRIVTEIFAEFIAKSEVFKKEFIYKGKE